MGLLYFYYYIIDLHVSARQVRHIQGDFLDNKNRTVTKTNLNHSSEF